MLRRLDTWVAVACLAGLTGCGGSTPLTTTLVPTVMTAGKILGGGILPQNCNDWTSPSWKAPQDWWNGLQPTVPPKVVGEGVVGFDQLFDTRPGGGCTKFRTDLYRLGFSYDLSASQALKGLVTKATLDFSSVIIPAGASPTALCQPMTGGGGSLLMLRPGETLPAAVQAFAYLGSGPTATPYPQTAKVFGMTFPWIAGPITQGVQTGVTVTTAPSGTGAASFAVDVTSLLQGALNRGDMAMAYMLSGSAETLPTVFPAGAIDCKTVYKVGSLVITHY